MPQVELDSVLCGGESKVACETIIDGERLGPPEEDPYMPVESFQVRIGEESDWIDTHAVYERDDSTKGNTNPKSQQTKNQQHHPPSNSQRFSGNLKPKAPIIALPNKIGQSGHLGHCAHRPANGMIFPKKKRASGGKSEAPVPEPGSPHVSCFGKVLSDREQRSQPHRRASAKEHVNLGKRSAGGWWGCLKPAFGCGQPKKGEYPEEVKGHGKSTLMEITVPLPGRFSAATEEINDVVPPTRLGEIKRFSSVRRSASWGREDKDDEKNVS